MRHLLLLSGAAVLLASTTAAAQSQPTGTTGAMPDQPPYAAPRPAGQSAPSAAPVRVPRAPPPVAVPRAPPPSAPAPPVMSQAPSGRCFARVALPQGLGTYQARVLVSPERTVTRVVPAQYVDVEERVMVTPERVRRVSVPATYRTVTETVVVRPGAARVETIPAEYRTVREPVVVQPGRWDWRPARLVGGAWPRDPRHVWTDPYGEVFWLVWTPPVTREVARQVLVRPARTETFTDPPVTRQVTRRVIDQPARVEQQATPAVYRTEKKRRLVTPERTETTVVPAEWRTVAKTGPVGPERLDWREAPCARAVTPDLIRRVQGALNARGHAVGPPDGVWGARTREALERFQRAQGLGEGALTVETLRALDLQA